ncbi:MAG TPA: S9 family peptidase [Caulobacteraceae bacterium]|nr:S9 family peptidase [Caulobacteraceae bacterium]
MNSAAASGTCAVFVLTALGFQARAAPPVADFGQLPAVENVELSPSGDRIAYIAVEGAERKLVVKQAGGPQLFAIGTGVTKPRAIDWLNNDTLVIETSNTVMLNAAASVSQHEFFQSTIIDVKTSKVVRVFGGQALILHATFGYFGHAVEHGHTWAYFGGLTLTGSGEGTVDFDHNAGSATHSHTDLYKVDVDTGHSEMVSGGTERLGTQWVVDAAGVIAATAQYDQSNGRWRLRAGGPGGGLVTEADDPAGDIGLEGQGRTPGSVVVNRPGGRNGDFSLIEYRGRVGDPGAPLFGDADIAVELRDPTTGLLIGGVTNSDEPQTILFDAALQAKFDKAARAFKGEKVALVSATADLDRMIVKTEGPGDSGTYFLIDIPARRAEAVAWAYPTILQDAVGPIGVVAYKAADGLEMQGVLTLPPGREAKRLPLVVMPHGGPEARDYVRFDWWAQAFASRGYAVFQPNFRGSNGFGKAFRDAGFGEWGRKMQTDVSDGVVELARQGVIDPKRVCIVGASYGGYVALAGVTVQQGLYRCAVSVGGISDPASMLIWESENAGQRSATMRYWHRYMGAAKSVDATLNAISPRGLVDRTDAPVLLVFGKDDTVVPNQQSTSFADALRHAGKAVEVLQLPGEDHWLSNGATRVQMLEASVAFVEKNNPRDATTK